jgi:hypothetical protein
MATVNLFARRVAQEGNLRLEDFMALMDLEIVV